MSSAFEHRSEPSQAQPLGLPELELDAEHQPEVARKSSAAGLRQIQQKASGEAGGKAGGDLQSVAARGIDSPTTALPHADRIQASFGGHDVSQIQAHVGGSTASEMGANAYASGQHVVFDRQPDLHTAAHEAAHVVQQARGVNLYGGVGEAGDQYEQQADAVADRVVAGQSAADLLGAPGAGATGATAAPGAAVQLDKGTAKPADATDADRQKAHGHAEIDSGSGMGSAIELATRKMYSATHHIEKIKKDGAKDDGGRFKVMDMMRQHAKDVQSELVNLELFLSGFETKFTGDKEKDNKINGSVHRLYADKLRQFKRAFMDYRVAYYQARDYGGHEDPIGTRDLDSDLGNNVVRPLFTKFDVKYDDVQEQKLDFSDASTRTFDDAAMKKMDAITAGVVNTAVKENLDAALDYAKVLRMEVKAGTKEDRSTDARRLSAHVREIAHHIGELDKTHKKEHRAHLKELVQEVEAVQAEHGTHEEVKTVLMNSGGTFQYNFDKIKAAAK
jgi:Domain of unknown function (DUF4157)